MESTADLDIDNDQLPDFRLLLTATNKGQGAVNPLPLKAGKSSNQDSQLQAPQTLEDQYDAFYEILQEERSISERNLSRATYDPSLGLFLVTVNKGGHFNTMGHTRNGQVYAFPEEALFLLDRGSLMVQHGGVDVTVQQMWALYFESERITSAATSSSTSSAMDRYQVYAYLKRLGFIVTRPGIYDQTRRSASTTTTTTIPSASASVSGATVLTHRYSFWDGWTLMSQFIWKRASSLFHLSIGRLSAWVRSFHRPGDRPLIPHNSTLSYGDILQSIRIIPSARLTGDTARRFDDGTQRLDQPVVDFEVYKPGGSFKKRDPGKPDFSIVVTRAGAHLPSLTALQVLLQGQSDPPLQNLHVGQRPGPPASDKAKKAKIHWPNLIYGIVDGAQVTFLRLTNESATLR